MDAGGCGDFTACRCSAEAEDMLGGADGPVADGETVRCGVAAGVPLLEPAWICPAAVDSWFVNDEIAQPAQAAAWLLALLLGWGVLMRGCWPPASLACDGGGRTESGIAEAAARIFCR